MSVNAPVYLHVGIRSQQVSEAALYAGFDGVIVDLQHGELDLAAATTLLRTVDRSLERTLVRIPSLDAGVIGTVLDAGAGGIIAPCVESAAEAAAVVAATKFAPVGARSLGPMRPGLYAPGDGAYGSAPTEVGNGRVKAIVQIESALGVERREEILTVPGLDGVYIGPADLALTLGETPRLDWSDGPVREAIDAVLTSAAEHGLVRGIFAASGQYARDLAAEAKIEFAGLGTDLGLIARAATSLLESYKD